MTSRILLGCRGVLLATVIAALICLPLNGASAAPNRGDVERPQAHDGALRLNDAQDSDANFRRTPTYARSTYAWPFAGGPYYGTVPESQWRAMGVLHTNVGSFRLPAGDLQLLPAELKTGNKLAQLGAQYFIVQVDVENHGDSYELAQAAIASTGGAVVDGLPVGAIVARLTADGLASVRSLPGVIATEPYHPALKLDPTIGRAPLPDPIKALSEIYSLDVLLFPGEDSTLVGQKLATLGANVLNVFPGQLRVELHRSLLAQVAALEPVRMVSESMPMLPHGEETTTVMQTGRWNQGALPYHDAGIDGSGNGITGTSPQVLMVLDSGIQLDSADISHMRIDVGTVGTAHRKVRRYDSTALFGGTGDLFGCDNPQQGGFTHGQVVSATALGNATNVTGGYGTPWNAADIQGNLWDLDGVAPGAVLVAFDGQITVVNVSCSDPLQDTISPGDVYGGPNTGSLGVAYTQNGAKIVNFSWGADSNTYSANASDIDDFINDKGDAMVFVSAGNAGADDNMDGNPDELTLGTPATTKNGIAVGASRNATDPGSEPESRASFSSMGPAVSTTVNRVAPLLMAPGDEAGGGSLGLSSEFACRSGDNDQANPPACDIIAGVEGTSFSSPAAAGAGLLSRDYFAQGFYPSGTQRDADRVSNISGALLKALLIDSADFMTGVNLTRPFRFNNEQGYGRIQLDNALRLESWPPSPTGLIVTDGGIAGGVNSTTLPGTINAIGGGTQTTTFTVCNDQEELRVALAWVEGSSSSALINDLDLEVISPDCDAGGPGLAQTYLGNYFTDDNNRNRSQDAGEDCPDFFGLSGTVTNSQWTIPRCGNSPTDIRNLTEAVMLTNDLRADNDNPPAPPDPNPADDSQVCAGTWTLNVKAKAGGNNASQRYAVAIAGGVCIGSSVRFDKGGYACNSTAEVTVSEFSEGGDLNPSAGDVTSRTLVEVLNPSDVVVDSESGIAFTAATGLRFDSADLILSDSTARQNNNGVLDVRNGDRVRVTYTDTTAVRRSFSEIDCTTSLTFGAITFADFGEDFAYLILGGCERNARGLFEFGSPDKNLDAGETLGYRFAFGSLENEDLENVQATLRCVDVDANSPAACLPNGSGCTAVACGGTCDPLRADNPACDGGAAGNGTPLLTVLDSPKTLGLLPAGAAISANFSIVMASDAVFTAAPNGPSPKVEFLLEIRAATSGKTAAGLAISRHKLNVDEQKTLYNTDFPTGGVSVEIVDRNNNEIAENPTTNIGDFLEDYRFETKTYADMTASGRNRHIRPWHFDADNGGFTSGLTAVADEATIADAIAQWGEDKNFNNLLDGNCRGNTLVRCSVVPNDPVCTANTTAMDARCNSNEDRDGVDITLNQNWNTRGGCGWQTRAPGSCSTVTTRGCHTNRDCLGRCQNSSVPDLIPDTNRLCTVTGDCPTSGLCIGIPQVVCTTTADCATAVAGQCSGNPLIKCGSDAICTANTAGTCTLTCVTETCQAPAGTCTGPAQTTGGVWHTGRIDFTSLATCMVNGSSAGQCQRYETVSGGAGVKLWMELLATPVMEKVNQGLDSFGDPTHRVEITAWEWNASIDLTDDNVSYTWEFDTDSDKLEPVDLFADGTVLNGGTGKYGAVSAEGNPDLSDGFSVFAPMGTCSISGRVCNESADCRPPVGGQVCSGSPTSVNGTVGGNRHGKNGCFFEGVGTIPTLIRPDLGLAQPFDDDFDNNGAGGADEFVKINGPVRNQEIGDWNGPDMRFTTLEDINGATGKRFQAALGMLNFESTDTAMNPANRGYGLAVDDMFVEWAEISQIPDTTVCATGGACGTIDLGTTNFFEGNSLVTVTVLDSTPYGSPAASTFVNCVATPADAVCVNDCNDNGLITDGGIDTNDCDMNGTPDVIIRATSEVEPTGELVAINRQSTGVYKGEVPISAVFNSVGILFIARQGVDAPTVTVTYNDYEDGTGNVCRNDVDPNAWSEVQAGTAVFFDTGIITLVTGSVTEVGTAGVNHDNDGIADTGETVDLAITVRNATEDPIDNVFARISTNDISKVECVLNPFISVGNLASRVNVTPTEKFRFKIRDDANRSPTGVNDKFSVTFNVTMSADSFSALSVPQSLIIDIDLDATGGSGPTTFIEGFEGGLGQFTADNIDFGRNNFPNSEGYRCQYSDPDWVNSNSYGAITDCFLGATAAQADGTQWHIETPTGPPAGGRSYLGSNSLHYGIDLVAAQGFTSSLAILEGVRTGLPVFLDPALSSELSFKHQTSLVDDRTVNTTPGQPRAADRWVVMGQLADNSNNAVGSWVKLEPYLNTYDVQNEDNYTNCMFDPVDDGTDEEDFFDPTDPDRRLGPSTTCFPAFAFAQLGETQNPFAVSNIGRASEGPGLVGIGAGTWVESRFDLGRFKGRRVRLRFTSTAIKAGTFEDYQALFGLNTAGPDPGDDGVWIDDVRVSNTLTSPATLSPDGDTIAPIACGFVCNSVTAILNSTPATTTAAPGQVVELNASLSTTTRCSNGTLQYRFCRSTDNDCFDAGDVILRGFSDDAILVDAPTATTNYAVDVRCSSLTSCFSSAGKLITVNCPGGTLGGQIRMCGTTTEGGCPGNKTGILRANTVSADWLKANFVSGTTVAATFYNVASATYRSNHTANPLDNSADGNPLTACTSTSCAAGAGFFYLAKKDGPLTEIGFCNSNTWRSDDGSGAARDTTFTPNP